MTQPLPPPQVVYVTAATRRTNGFAVAALVFGILWMGGLGSLLAVIFGAVAISQINQSNGGQGGKGMAVAGFVLGIVFLLLTPLVYLG